MLMGIQDQYSVAEALLVRDWQALSRSRNQNISLLRATLRDLTQRSDATELDTFFWGPPNNNSESFSTKKQKEFLRPRAAAKDWSNSYQKKNVL